jgi:hypothetical protein
MISKRLKGSSPEFTTLRAIEDWLGLLALKTVKFIGVQDLSGEAFKLKRGDNSLSSKTVWVALSLIVTSGKLMALESVVANRRIAHFII